MIKLYRDLKFFDKDNVLYDNDGFFDTQVSVKEMYGDFLDVMKRIDHAKLLDMKTGTIKTPYGTCNREYLSSGCKTVLNAIYLYRHKERYQNKKAIYATECGANALEVLFEYVEKYNFDINIILEHCDNLMTCKERDYVIDGKLKSKSLAFYWAHREV